MNDVALLYIGQEYRWQEERKIKKKKKGEKGGHTGKEYRCFVQSGDVDEWKTESWEDKQALVLILVLLVNFLLCFVYQNPPKRSIKVQFWFYCITPPSSPILRLCLSTLAWPLTPHSFFYPLPSFPLWLQSKIVVHLCFFLSCDCVCQQPAGVINFLVFVTLFTCDCMHGCVVCMCMSYMRFNHSQILDWRSPSKGSAFRV